MFSIPNFAPIGEESSLIGIQNKSADTQQKQLANALAQINLQYAPQMNQLGLQEAQIKNRYLEPEKLAELAYKQAQQKELEQKVRYPGMGATGTAGQAWQALMLQDYLKQNPDKAREFSAMMGQQGDQGQSPDQMSSQGQQPLQQGPRLPLSSQQQQSLQQRGAGQPFQNVNPQQMQQPGNPLVHAIVQGMMQQNESKQAAADYNRVRTNGYNFNQLPVSQKELVLAKLAGMGIEATEGLRMLNKGKGIDEIAQEKGFDPNNLPDPIYPTTPTDRNRMRQRNAAIVELKEIDDVVTKGMGPYIGVKIGDWSPAQISDAISGKNTHQLAMFLAANALKVEASAVRMKAMGGNVSEAAIENLTKTAYGSLEPFRGYIADPKAWTEAQDIISKTIGRAAGKANKAMMSLKLENEPSDKEMSIEVSKKPVHTMTDEELKAAYQ
jgi:hypothetical protein